MPYLVTGQTVNGTTASGSTVTVTLPAAPKIGNTIVAAGSWSSGTATATVMAGATALNFFMTPIPLSPNTNNAGTGRDGLWYIPVKYNMSNTFKLTTSAGSLTLTLGVMEIAETDGASSFEQSVNYKAATSSTAVSLPLITTTNNLDMLVASFGTSQVLSSAGGGWTIIGSSIPASGECPMYLAKAVAGATGLTATISPSGTWHSIVAAFRSGTNDSAFFQEI